MAATGISERVDVGPAGHGHAVPTSFWALTLGSIGVVYGDIGTSPLYALKESLAAATTHAGHAALTREMVIGVVSLILWALIIIVTLKYVAIVLRADNNARAAPSPS
jgi:KUP system potassium uptake protein